MADAPPSIIFESEEVEKEEERTANHNFPLFLRKGIVSRNTSNPADERFLLLSNWLDLRPLGSHPLFNEK